MDERVWFVMVRHKNTVVCNAYVCVYVCVCESVDAFRVDMCECERVCTLSHEEHPSWQRQIKMMERGTGVRAIQMMRYKTCQQTSVLSVSYSAPPYPLSTLLAVSLTIKVGSIPGLHGVVLCSPRGPPAALWLRTT